MLGCGGAKHAADDAASAKAHLAGAVTSSADPTRAVAADRAQAHAAKVEGEGADRTPTLVPPADGARRLLSAVRARSGSDTVLPPAIADGFYETAAGLRPRFSPARGTASAAVTFPKRADAPVRIIDTTSGMSVDVAINGARKIDAATADGYVVYRGGHVTGATLLHRALPEGAEDFLSFDQRSRPASISYKLGLRQGVAGLRLVAGTLEMLDTHGAPRLRVAPPYIVGADGVRTEATLAVKGCAVDTNPAGPWDRPVTAPGANICTLRVSWDDADVEYPAILDPKWTTTNTMASPRQDHTMTFLPATGKVLVAGGRTNGTNTSGIPNADLFDPATNTWSPTQSMPSARFSHAAIQLNTGSNANTSGKVLVAGGVNAGGSVATCLIYTVTGTGAGTWTASMVPSMSVARHLHTATLLGNGNVLVAGGMTNTTVIGSAAVYNPGGTSFGTWTAVATNMAARRFHTATFLTSSNTAFNNKVLMLGGNSGGTSTVTTFQLFDQAASTWSTATSLPTAVVREGHTATKLANGNVLLTGGKAGTALPLQDTFVFTIPASGSTPTFPGAGTMTSRRWAHTATLLQSAILPSGQSLVVVGGSADGTTSIPSAELWNGASTWTATTALATPLRAHTATLLTNGKVLVAGGINSNAVDTGQVYDPSFALACTSNSQCASGFCTNGVCCAVSSCPTCQACNVGANAGVCANVPSTASDSRCTASPPCGNTGLCNGSGACAVAGSNVSCGSQSCTGSTQTNATLCTGTGQCGTATTMSCSPYACGTTACRTTCSSNAECASSTFYCTGTNGTCQARKAQGLACTANNECTSGFCTDGVCCGSASCSTCQACNVTGHLGTCFNVSSTTSDSRCTTSPPCGNTGLCDGLGACALAGSTTPCGSQSCSGSTQTNARFCTGTGTCGTATTMNCSPYVCGATACKTTCSSSADCASSSSYCAAGACAAKKANGAACANTGECTSGFCVSGVCCNTGCTGTCSSCQGGTCSPVAAGTTCRALNGACDVAETCNGTALDCPADGFAPASTVCRPPAPGGCDIAETCTGTSAACPTDVKKAPNAPCDDSNACTGDDVCQSDGTCRGFTSFTCVAPNTCQDAGTCNAGKPAPMPPAPADLIGWWKLEGNGDDSSGHNNNLTVEGGVTSAPGRFGLGMKFDGTGCMTKDVWQQNGSNWTSVWDDARMQGAPGVTMMAWISQPASASCSTTEMSVMGKGWDYTTGAICYGGVYPGVAAWARPSGAQQWGYPGQYGFSGDEWQLLAVTWDKNEVWTYLNGRLISGLSDTGQFGDVDPVFALGCMVSWYWSGFDRVRHFAGTIDEAMLWRKALSADEIAAYWAAADPCAPHPLHAESSPCTDNDLCTEHDACHSGICGGDQVTCQATTCHDAGYCSRYVGCVTGPAVQDGATCSDNDATTDIDTCSAGACVGSANPALVLGFEAPGRWSVNTGGTGSVVGLSSNHTQGATALEVTAQNTVSFHSVRMGPLGTVGPLALLDILLPSQQGNRSSFGTLEVIANAPSAGISNVSVGQAPLTGLALATWQTLAFQVSPDLVTRLSGYYNDLTFTIVLSVAPNETGHYMFDNLRFSAEVVPTMEGIARDSANVLKAIFTYTTAAPSVGILYGPANSLSDEGGFIRGPLELPPQQFVAAPHAAFVATLVGQQLVWKVGFRSSAAATPSLPPLQTEVGPDGGRQAVLPDGTRVPLDSVDPLVATAIVPSDTSYTAGDIFDDTFNGANPIGPTSAGTLPGTFNVTDDGAAQYVLPIETPPGRAGVEPHLALVYNSRTGSGFLGPGWSIRGLHRITRCKRTYGVGLERGQLPAAVAYSDSDELCLDGERLVSVAPGEYRTKRDQQTKIVKTGVGGSATFTAYRKDGTIEYYGDGTGHTVATRLSNITIQPAEAVGFSTVTREWLMSRVVDRYGNTMTATYDFPMVRVGNVAVNGPGVPKTLSYTSNPTTGRTATKTVTFVYDTVSDMAVPKFESGVFIGGGGQVLTEIDISAPRPLIPGLVNRYKFTYTPSSMTGRSLLQRVQRCGGDGTCMAPTTFEWEISDYSFRHVVSQVNDFHPATRSFNGLALADESNTRYLVAGDVNGDGRQDLVYRTFVNPDGVNTVENLGATRLVYRFGGANDFDALAFPTVSPNVHGESIDGNSPTLADNNVLMPPILVDITGDGRSDLISTFRQWEGSPGAPSGPLKRYDFTENVTNEFGRILFSPLPRGITADGWADPTQNVEEGNNLQWNGSIVLADVDGDGLIDVGRQYLLGVSDGTTDAALRIRRNQNGTLGPYTSTGALWGMFSVPGSTTFANELFTADLDGDGRTEIVMQQTDGQHSFGVHGTTAYDYLATNVPYLTSSGNVLLDLNGDGLRDVISTNSVWLNTGNGFLPLSGGDHAALMKGLVDDVNGDGMDDVVVPGCSATADGPEAMVYLSHGDGTFSQVTLRTTDGFVPPGLKIGIACPHVLMDVDGDGQKDLVQPELASDNLHIYFRDRPRPDRIDRIHDGLKSTISIGYSRYDGSANEPCAYPLACGARNVEVVSSYSVDEGKVVSGQALNTQYTMKYTGPTADAQGGGWVGFATVQRTNERTHSTDKRYFDLTTQIGNWRPFVGLPNLEEVTVPLSESGRTRTRSRVTTYKKIKSNPNDDVGPYAVQPEVIDEFEYEAGVLLLRSTHQSFTYDDFGNVKTHDTQHTNEGSTEHVEYGVENDRDKWLIGKVVSVTTTSTSAAGETDQRVTTFQVDPNTGAVTGRTIQPGDPQEQLSTTFTPNLDGLMTTRTDTPASGPPRTTHTDYDAIEGAWPAVITNPLGQVTRLSYHCGVGVLVSTVDPNGVKTGRQYDYFGRIRNSFDDTGNGAVYHYARPDVPEDLRSAGLIVSWQDALGRRGRMLTDDLGREISRSETALDGSHQMTITRAYDAISGKVGTVSRPFGATGGVADANAVWRFHYDELGRLTSTQPPGEALHTILYEGHKRTESVGDVVKGYTIEDPIGRVTLSANIEPTSPAPNHEIQTSYDYGAFGKLRHVHLLGGGTVTLSYDHLGRRTQIIDPDAGTRTTHFNAFGEVEREELGGQQDVTYDLDLLGRPVNVTSGDGVDTHQWDIAANGIGKVAFEQSSSGVFKSYNYRANGLPQSTTWTIENAAFTVDWIYAPGSPRLTGITYPSMGAGARFQVTLGYGGDGRLAAVFTGDGNTLFWRKTAAGDDGQVAAEEFPNGLGSIYDTDPVSGRMLHIAAGTGAVISNPIGTGRSFANPVQSLGYQYFPDGKLQGRTDDLLASSESFTYDNVDRLQTWQVVSGSNVQYGYDDLGNLTTRTESGPGGTANEIYHYGENGAGPHALTSGPDGAYSYDPSGRQKTRPQQPLLSYTHFDLPTQIQSSGGATVTFSYDADGARVLKKTAASQVISLAGLYERRVDGAVTTHVIYLPGDGRVIGQIVCDSGGTCGPPAYFHPDRLGTIDTVTSQGIVVGREKRDPYGRPYSPATMSGPDAAVTIGFTGAGEDAETGLVNLNRRLYDTRIGRFVSPDQLIKNPFVGQSYNRYTYAGNNPLSFVDPTGLQEAPPGTEVEIELPQELQPAESEKPYIVYLSRPYDDGFGTVSVNYVTYDGPPGAGIGDPTAPFSSFQSPETLPEMPTFNVPPSSSQDFVNAIVGGDGGRADRGGNTYYAEGGPNGGPTNGDVRGPNPLPAPRDWLTGEPGKFSIPLFGFGSLGGDPTKGLLQRLLAWIRGAPAIAAPAVGALSQYASDPARLNVLQHIYQNGLRTSQTVAQQLAGGRSFIPVQSILQTVGNGWRSADPQGVANQFLYQANAAYNGVAGVLEVLVNESSWQVYHVLFRSGFSLQ